ncbi:hypothetical protein N7I30_14040 [Aurantimonas litoralis]|nr:hypothetical protein [Aurantimonas litoralis]
MITLTDFGENKDARGRVPVDPAIFQQSGTRVLATTGQSMLANYGALTMFDPSAYIPQTVYELSIHDGNIYESDGGQIMNCDGSAGRLSVLPYWGHCLVSSGKSARVLLCSLNIGGSHAHRWMKGGDLFHRVEYLLDMLSCMGLHPTEWVHMQGQADMWSCTSSEAFAVRTARFIRDVQAAGYQNNMIVGLGAYQLYCTEANRLAIVRGQSVAAVEAGMSIGPNDDEWPVSMRVDGVHPNDQMRWYQWQRWQHAFGVIS